MRSLNVLATGIRLRGKIVAELLEHAHHHIGDGCDAARRSLADLTAWAAEAAAALAPPGDASRQPDLPVPLAKTTLRARCSQCGAAARSLCPECGRSFCADCQPCPDAPCLACDALVVCGDTEGGA